MCPLVVIVVTKFWNVASINVHSAVTGVRVKYADRLVLLYQVHILFGLLNYVPGTVQVT